MVERDGKIIDWDKYSLKINGKRKFLIGGEFHYWRVPDRERWQEILKSYKNAGLNCVRIYFHWGFHQPDEDVFDFEGNRDVNYLLEICEELGLYVLVAAGPYICAESTGGGFPLWLIQKREVRIRHMKKTAIQKYDEKYMDYCRKWMTRFVREIQQHQVSQNSNGCIIAFQIENEYPEKIVVLRGQRRYMEELMEIVRTAGITVPIYHNDFWENNAWNGLVDLYGFDKYVIHADKNPKELPLQQWNTREFAKKTRSLEKTVAEFGNSASESPMFIPELQGGWYNHWTVKYGYDELYNFYDENYQKLIMETLASQRTTMMMLYMFYGGTNYGTIGNPEVYTSYDYSAAIREYLFESNRMRFVRLFALFARTFESTITASEPMDKIDVNCTLKNIVYKQRRALDKTDLYFMRNFNKKEFENFSLTLSDGTRIPKVGEQQLDERHSFIAIANHKIGTFNIKFCSLPIILKGNYHGGKLLVVLQNGGELLLHGKNFATEGYINSVEEDSFTRFSFVHAGFDTITDENNEKLYIICLELEEALTLNSDLDPEDIKLTWGGYSSHFRNDGILELYTTGKQNVRLLCCQDEVKGFKDLKRSRIPGMKFTELGSEITEDELKKVELKDWKMIKTQWSRDKDIWKRINYDEERDPLDHGYFGAHTLYKWEFTPDEIDDTELKLNTRHKSAVWVNGKCIGGHSTYRLSTFNPISPGAMNGPDPTFLGTRTYKIGDHIKKHTINTMLIITESLGQNKQFFPTNDIRNPRGIIKAKINEKLVGSDWYIASKDVIGTDDPYNWSGLPGQNLGYHEGKGEEWTDVENPSINDEITWLKASFNVKMEKNKRKPLRLHLEGSHNVSIFLNGHYIGRYWGSAGPQHDFYLLDGYLENENTLVLASWTSEQDNLSASIKPYIIDMDSGNLKEDGSPLVYEKHVIRFEKAKPWKK